MRLSIYHCGHCGSLFQAEAGEDDDRVCGECGHKPGTGEWPAEEGKKDEGGDDSKGNSEMEAGSAEKKARHPSGKRRKSRVAFWAVVSWVLLMAFALWMHRQHSNSDVGAAERVRAGEAREIEKIALLDAALPRCHTALSGFLNGDGLEERSRFVADTPVTAGKMEKFYHTHPLPQLDTGRIARIGQELLDLDGERVVWTHWQEGEEGQRFDAVFRRESGVWLLDWEHFSGYSKDNWELFLAGKGSDEGEFRLLAREIPSGDEEDDWDRRLRFELLSPEAASQQFVVNRHSDEGLLLNEAFAAKRAGNGLFGGALEPEGAVRVRVIVNRSDFGGVTKFEVEKIIACHWIGSDAPGFDLKKLKEDAFGVN